MPLIRLKGAQEATWRYVVILPPVSSPKDLVYLDKGEPLPVPTAQQIAQAIGRNEPCGEIDGFAWQHDLPVSNAGAGPSLVIDGTAPQFWWVPDAPEKRST
jgi:hypothetical protein